jgi:hypothetical protein
VFVRALFSGSLCFDTPYRVSRPPFRRGSDCQPWIQVAYRCSGFPSNEFKRNEFLLIRVFLNPIQMIGVQMKASQLKVLATRIPPWWRTYIGSRQEESRKRVPSTESRTPKRRIPENREPPTGRTPARRGPLDSQAQRGGTPQTAPPPPNPYQSANPNR